MAVNAETGIDYDVDRFAVLQISSGNLINLNAQWLRPDGGPVSGGINDRKYYKKVPADPPSVDHRYTVATTWTVVDADPAPPEGWPSGTYEQSHVVTKLEAESLKLQVEAEFQRQVRLQYPASVDPSLILLAGKALAKKQDGTPLTAAEQASIDAVKATGSSIDQLVARKAELEAAIDADEDYDITEGWTVV